MIEVIRIGLSVEISAMFLLRMSGLSLDKTLKFYRYYPFKCGQSSRFETQNRGSLVS